MNAYKLVFKPFYYLMDQYVRFNKDWTFEDVKLGSKLSKVELDALHTFRMNCYKNDAPYLIPQNDEELAQERAFDLNSFHIIAKDQSGAIIGSLRLLKRPFEMEKLSFSEEHKVGLDEYLEISRLVCSVRQKGLGRRLLIRAGTWSIQETTYRGFTAICKCHRLPMFKRFGLTPKASFSISERQDQTYHLIRADFSQISTVTLKAFIALNLQRLSKLIEDSFSFNRPAL
tara:strand:+ start:576 stop:1262 length:687 start_codon:yes stop_codon:yes gene_type:complete